MNTFDAFVKALTLTDARLETTMVTLRGNENAASWKNFNPGAPVSKVQDVLFTMADFSLGDEEAPVFDMADVVKLANLPRTPAAIGMLRVGANSQDRCYVVTDYGTGFAMVQTFVGPTDGEWSAFGEASIGPIQWDDLLRALRERLFRKQYVPKPIFHVTRMLARVASTRRSK